MVEFKQIIGRGTRLYDGKDYFTVYDFVKAHEMFNDPEWDGEPLPPDEPKSPGDPKPNQPIDPIQPPIVPPVVTPPPPPPMLEIKLSDGKARQIKYIAATTYWGPDGRPITAQQFFELLFGDLENLVLDEDDLRAKWRDPDQREKFFSLLEQKGYDDEKLADIRRLVDAEQSDMFDVLAYIRFASAPHTRQHRADLARESTLNGCTEEMCDFIESVLNTYVKSGERELTLPKLGQFLNAKYGTIADAKAKLGDVATIRNAYLTVQETLYKQ